MLKVLVILHQSSLGAFLSFSRSQWTVHLRCFNCLHPSLCIRKQGKEPAECTVWFHVSYIYWYSRAPNNDSASPDSQSHMGVNVIHLMHQNESCLCTDLLYLYYTLSSIRRHSIWYYAAGPIKTGISKASARICCLILLVFVLFPPPPPNASATPLSGQRKGLFRHYLSRLVFRSTELRMYQSNPSVSDPRFLGCIVVQFVAVRAVKGIFPLGLCLFLLFFLQQSCGWNVLWQVAPPCGWWLNFHKFHLSQLSVIVMLLSVLLSLQYFILALQQLDIKLLWFLVWHRTVREVHIESLMRVQYSYAEDV